MDFISLKLFPVPGQLFPACRTHMGLYYLLWSMEYEQSAIFSLSISNWQLSNGEPTQ